MRHLTHTETMVNFKDSRPSEMKAMVHDSSNHSLYILET